jgi:predicted dehydrogenase
MNGPRALTAALIGLGNIAWRYDGGRVAPGAPALTHASVYDRSPRTTLTIGMSPDTGERRAAREALGIDTTDSLPDLLAARPDVVSICSPSALHAEHLRACLDAGVPMIWLEKPAATRLTDLDAVIAASTGASVVAVNFQRRYQPAYRVLRDLCTSGELGRCHHIQAVYSRGLETNGSHMVDQVLFLAGDGRPFTLDWVGPTGGPDNPGFAMTFDGGLTAVVTGLDLPYHCIDIAAVFDGGRVSLLYGGLTAVFERRVEQELFPGFHRLRPEPDPRFPGDCDIGGSMAAALDDLIAAHETGRDAASSLTTARAGQALMQAVWERLGGQP